MEANWGKLLRIGVFYDGHYFYNVSNYYNYQHTRKARISISGLHEFIRNEVSAVTGRDIRLCQIVDAHYFRGRFSAQKSDELNKLYNERLFDDILMRENVVTHYLPLKYDKDGNPQEKGVDVWLALEAYELAIYKRFDVLVLIACDGDYVPLVRKVNTVGSQVMLLSWDLEYMDKYQNPRVTRTSQALIKEVSYYVPMHEKIDSRASGINSLIKNLFVPPKEPNRPLPSVTLAEDDREPNRPLPSITPGEDDVESPPANLKESTIHSIKDGYGFIRDSAINNLFFFYNSLENIDFNELKQGMRVKYIQETKEDGKFVASKVWVVK